MELKNLTSRFDSYLIFKHKNKNVMDIIHNLFFELVDENKNIKLRHNYYYFNSLKLPHFTNLYHIWYENNKKSYPAVFIEKWFNKDSLAFWFLFGGKFHTLYDSIIFDYDHLDKKSLEHLSTIIFKKCNIKCSIKTQHKTSKIKYYLCINKESYNDFLDIINQYNFNFIINKPEVIYKPGSIQYSILIGLLLGDGSLTSRMTEFTGKARYEHTCKHKEMLINLAEQSLPLYFTKGEPTPWPRNNPTQWWRGSKFLPELHKLYILWYKQPSDCFSEKTKKTKIIPFDILNKYFDIVSLSWWFMGDGFYDNNDRTFYFCTDNFTHEECLFLAGLLFRKFNIKANVVIRRRNIMWRIRLSRHSVSLFRKLVSPYILPIFKYKLGNTT